jgi:lipopolysaccharide transport system permease protein
MGKRKISAETLSRVAPPVTIIEASRPFSRQQLVELWRYRHLALMFAARDVKARYKQTVLGFTWVFVQPLALTTVYSLIFGKLAKIPSEGVPYPLFLLSGLALWQLFATATNAASTSLVTQGALISKVYFPRIIVLLSPVLAGLLDFAVVLALVAAAQVAWGIYPGWALLLAPAFVLMAAASVLALSLWLAALDAFYRDVRYVLAFGLQIAYFATPVVYPLSVVPAHYAPLYALNPMAAIIQGFRWSLLGGATPPPEPIALAAAIVIILGLLVGGYAFFRRAEGSLVDRL